MTCRIQPPLATMDTRPPVSDYAPSYERYVALVPEGLHVRDMLAEQVRETQLLVSGADPDAAYAPGKWTVRQVVQHLSDAERVFATRALRIARGDPTPQPGFDENAYADATAADRRPLAAVVDELAAVRAATVALVDGLPPEAWARTGTASGHAVSVHALVWIVAGHERHHAAILRERYGLGQGAR